MIAIVCKHENRRHYGHTKAGTLRYKCKDCGKSFTASTELFAGMRIGLDRAVEIVTLLVEGMSVRGVSRVTDTHIATILDLLVIVGERCAAFEAERIRDVQVEDVQCDEIWQYIYCKAKTAERKKYVGGCGDSYTFTAIERHTKLLLTWHHGRRSLNDAHAFCRKLNYATLGHFQLSTDGYAPYLEAVAFQLGEGKVDHGRVIKVFGEPPEGAERKYSPGRICGCRKDGVLGLPWRDRICTSHVERMNGSIRTFVKRMCRLTYCFSKRWDNHRAALGLYFAHYNWCRKHRSLGGKTPAMASGLATEVWTVRELLQRVAD